MLAFTLTAERINQVVTYFLARLKCWSGGALCVSKIKIFSIMHVIFNVIFYLLHTNVLIDCRGLQSQLCHRPICQKHQWQELEGMFWMFLLVYVQLGTMHMRNDDGSRRTSYRKFSILSWLEKSSVETNLVCQLQKRLNRIVMGNVLTRTSVTVSFNHINNLDMIH